jgi:hypothetical protein
MKVAIFLLCIVSLSLAGELYSLAPLFRARASLSHKRYELFISSFHHSLWLRLALLSSFLFLFSFPLYYSCFILQTSVLISYSSFCGLLPCLVSFSFTPPSLIYVLNFILNVLFCRSGNPTYLCERFSCSNSTCGIGYNEAREEISDTGTFFKFLKFFFFFFE